MFNYIKKLPYWGKLSLYTLLFGSSYFLLKYLKNNKNIQKLKLLKNKKNENKKKNDQNIFYITGNNSYELGLSQGMQLKEKIHKVVQFYMDYFMNEYDYNENELKQIGENVKKSIYDFDSNYSDEIDGISEGSELPQWKLYCMQARSEIMSLNDMKVKEEEREKKRKENDGECTSLYSKYDSILGQNWDWNEIFQENSVIVHIHQPFKADDDLATDILMLTEPGMIGKIGLNNFGIGTNLNFLSVKDMELIYNPPDFMNINNNNENDKEWKFGVPIHCLLRAALDASSLNMAFIRLRVSPLVFTTGFILLGNSEGESRMLEFLGDKMEIILPNIEPKNLLFNKNNNDKNNNNDYKLTLEQENDLAEFLKEATDSFTNGLLNPFDEEENNNNKDDNDDNIIEENNGIYDINENKNYFVDMHTNHYLGFGFLRNNIRTGSHSSYKRYERAKEIIEGYPSDHIFKKDDLINLLLDQKDNKYPILKPFNESWYGKSGTVATILLDLKNKKIEMKKSLGDKFYNDSNYNKDNIEWETYEFLS